MNQVTGQSQNAAGTAYSQRYIELIRLVNRQRDTLNSQQADMTKVINKKNIYIFVEIQLLKI